jgi:hypothetical protein
MGLLFLDWGNRGYNLWTVDGPYSVTLVQGQATYNLPADTVDLIDHVIRTDAGQEYLQTDLNISRISLPTYLSIPNKLIQGRPIQVWINRQGAQNDQAVSPNSNAANPNYVEGIQYPQFTVWPTPDGSQTWTFVYYRVRQIQDVGSTGYNGVDIPPRFLPALVAGLAYYLSLKIPGAMERTPLLKQIYDETWEMATGEDREKAAVRLVPRQSFIY